jgi:CIC family chloride channel protein
LGFGTWAIVLFLVVLVVAKFLATALTISAGGNGGVFAPSLFLGAVVGFIVARSFNLLGLQFSLPESAFALVGMAGMMTGVMRAPLTGVFLIAEVTSGYALIIPLMIVVAVSFVISYIFEPHSIYARQLALKGQIWTHDKDREILSLISIKRAIEYDLVTLQPEATLRELVNVVKISPRNVFPIVDAEQNLRGIILLDDIREVMFDTTQYDILTVDKLMHAPPGYVDARDDMAAVMKKFKGTGAWNLPVLNEGKYVGFVSKSRIFNIYRTMLVNQQREE